MLNETLEAAKMLEEDWGVSAEVWIVTSYSELRKEAEEVNRWNLMHPTSKQKKSHVEKCLNKNKTPIVAVSDYVKMVSEQISPFVTSKYYSLGTDGFGRSDTRENLRRFFEVDRYYIVLNSIRALVDNGHFEIKIIDKVIKKYNLDPEKPNPINV